MDRDIKERTFKFSLQVIRTYMLLPRNGVGYVLGKQLVRSGTSVGANVEEATAAASRNDFTYKMSIALREARETNYWLRLMAESRLIEVDSLGEILRESNEIKSILGAIVSKLRSTAKS